MIRPSWSDTFMTIAAAWAERSTCPRAACGAVFVDADQQVLTSGYNGAPRRQPHCNEVGCLLVDGHCRRTVHAELNGVIQAARVGTSLRGATLYCTTRPCLACAPVLAQLDLTAIVYRDEYDTDGSREEVVAIFERAGTALVHLITGP